MRCEVFKPNDEHIQDHPEFEIARSEETQAKWEALIKDTADNPRMNIRQVFRKVFIFQLMTNITGLAECCTGSISDAGCILLYGMIILLHSIF